MNSSAKVALVTGASSGIGRALALGLARRGCHVILTGRDPGKLDAATAALTQPGGSAEGWPADLADDEQILKLAARFRSMFDGLDVLVHSAGTFRMGSFESSTEQALDEQYRVNLRAPSMLTRLLLPCLRQRKGQVVFVNSSAGLATHPNWGAYSATKAGLKMLADSLRTEVNPQGIRVLSVYPGRTATPMQETVHRLENRAYQPDKLLQPEDVAAMVLQALELPRTAEVTDIMVRPASKPT